MRNLDSSNGVGSDVVSSEGNGLYSESGKKDLEMLATILHDNINNIEGEHDFNFREYSVELSKKYGIPSRCIEVFGWAFYLYLEDTGALKE